MKTKLVGKCGLAFQYSNPLGKPKRVRKPKTLNKIKCRKCKLPKKAAYSSSKRLSVFTVDYYAQNGEHLEHQNTKESKELFELERRETFCECIKQKPSDLTDFHNLLISIFGKVPNRKTIKAFRKNPNYRLPTE